MISNPATLSRKALPLFRVLGFSRKPISHFAPHTKFPINPLQTSGFRTCSSNFRLFSSNYVSGHVGKELGRFGNGFRGLGLDHLRFSSVSGGGSGGSGGYGGSSGGDSGGKGEAGGGGGSDWSFLSWYLGLLEKYPVLTKAVTSAILTLIGDVVCQVAIDQAPSLDLKRIFLFTLLGLVLVGPTLHFWYLYLSKLVTVSGASGAFMRLLLDQFLFSPMFIGLFLSTLITLEGRPSQVVPKLQQEWFSSVLANWQLWIPFQFLNFRFVPQQFQVLAANLIALIWNVILSYKAHKEILPK